MPLEILTIPCYSDNYAYALRDTATSKVALIDAPEAPPVLKSLADHGWSLDQVLITHHHYDHVDGLGALVADTGAKVTGAAKDAGRLPSLDHTVSDGDTFFIGEQRVIVFDVSGHTLGHVAYYFPDAHALFTGDSLMVMGCGRLFEGDAETMWASLGKLMQLPGETQIYSGHEYTAANAQFALSVEPENKALTDRTRQISETRARGEDTMGPTLALEMATNPFLRADLPEVKSAVGMENASDAEVFAEIRKRKDNF